MLLLLLLLLLMQGLQHSPWLLLGGYIPRVVTTTAIATTTTTATATTNAAGPAQAAGGTPGQGPCRRLSRMAHNFKGTGVHRLDSRWRGPGVGPNPPPALGILPFLRVQPRRTPLTRDIDCGGRRRRCRQTKCGICVLEMLRC